MLCRCTKWSDWDLNPDLTGFSTPENTFTPMGGRVGNAPTYPVPQTDASLLCLRPMGQARIELTPEESKSPVLPMTLPPRLLSPLISPFGCRRAKFVGAIKHTPTPRCSVDDLH